MFSDCRMDHTTVKQYFGRVCDIVENPQRQLELVVVVVVQGFNPSLDFLVLLGPMLCPLAKGHYLLERHVPPLPLDSHSKNCLDCSDLRIDLTQPHIKERRLLVFDCCPAERTRAAYDQMSSR